MSALLLSQSYFWLGQIAGVLRYLSASSRIFLRHLLGHIVDAGYGFRSAMAAKVGELLSRRSVSSTVVSRHRRAYDYSPNRSPGGQVHVSLALIRAELHCRDLVTIHGEVTGGKSSFGTQRYSLGMGFAAVGGDAVSFELCPPRKQYERSGKSETVAWLSMHEVLLGGSGLPARKLLDLEELRNICKEQGRWEFFLSSVSLNIPGGVHNPPNCVACF